MPDAISPAAMRFNEINRRADLAKTPIQFAQSLGAGLQAGRAVEDYQAQVEKRKKAAEFEQMLQQGLPAMQQAWGELPPEDRQRIPDPRLFVDSRDATVSWWGLATEAHLRAQVGTALAAGNVAEAAGAAARMAKDPTALVNSAGERELKATEAKAKAEEARAKAEKEKRLRDMLEVLTSSVNPDIVKKGGKLKSEDINLITTKAPTELQDYPAYKSWISELRNQAPPPQPSASLGQRRDEDFQRRIRLVKKDLEPKVKIAQAFLDVNNVLPGGIDGEGDVAGYGVGTKPFRKWFVSDAASKLRTAVAALTNIVLKDRSGQAVTPNEMERIEEELGLTATSPVSAFRDALRRKRDNLREEMKNDENTDPEAAAELKKRGFLGSDLLTPSPNGNTEIHLTGEKAKRLAELRAKKAAGTLK